MGKFLEAASIIFRKYGRPMSAREVTDKAVDLRILEFSNGRTPWQTMKAKLSVNIRTLGRKSPFMRTAKGRFFLRDAASAEYSSPPWQKTISPREDVLVLPTSELRKLGSFQFISKKVAPYAETLHDPQKVQFVARTQAETDPRYKQIISYVLVQQHDALLRFVRGSYSNVRTHLLGRYCVGFGGHVQSRDMADAPLFSMIDNGYTNSVHRELNEELRLPSGSITPNNLRLIGVLNDDSSDLGQVHFAFIHLLNLDHLSTRLEARDLKREKSVNQLEFIPIQDLGKDFERYEYWSKLCIREFFRTRIKIAAKVHRVHNYRIRNHKAAIAIVGNIGSGKTEACRLLKSRFRYDLISSGRVIQNILGLRSLAELGREKFQNLALEFIRRSDGPDLLVNEIHARLMGSPMGLSVIDGIRNLRTFDILKGRLGERLTLIYVDSTIDNSYRMFRAREGRSLSVEDFYRLLGNPVEAEIPELMRVCNVVFYNHGSRESYLKTIAAYFAEELS